MSDIAQELDDNIMDIIRDAIRPMTDANEIMLASVTIDIIRAINEAGFEIVRREPSHYPTEATR